MTIGNSMNRFQSLLFLLFFFAGTLFYQSADAGKETEDFSACMLCHKGIERLDENHGFPCQQCHVPREARGRSLENHDPIIRYPGSPSHADTFCGPCHEKEISALKNSLHYTLAGMISQTRYLWGAQPDPAPRYSASAHKHLKPLPPNPPVIQSPADLVDDLLRRRCFSCHLGTEPPQARGFYRGSGCGACHLLYENDGIYRGNDRAVKGKRGYPGRHTFCKPIPVRQCLHCHNGPRVGADYAGLFEHDYHQSYRTPVQNGTLPERIYLMDYHALTPDVHYERGMLCTDCHGKGDVMGRGTLVKTSQEGVKVRCRDCHGETRNPESGTNPKSETRNTKQQNTKQQNTKHKTQNIPAHNISEMKRLHCVSCHGAWGFTDYGPSLLRDDREDLTRWSPWRLQGDASVAECFDEQGRFLRKYQTPDTKHPGPWFLSWRFRRWEYLTLGVDAEARITPFRPRYQYLVSYADKNGHVILDSVMPERGDGRGSGWAWMPFYPHTIRKRGRNCEACHGQGLAAGCGLREGEGPDISLTQPSPPVYPSIRLLSEQERKHLLVKTEKYRRWRFRVIMQDFGNPPLDAD